MPHSQLRCDDSVPHDSAALALAQSALTVLMLPMLVFRLTSCFAQPVKNWFDSRCTCALPHGIHR